MELPKHERVGEKGSSFGPVSAYSRIKPTGAESLLECLSTPLPGSRVWQNVDVRHMIKTQITVNNVRQAVVDRWALGTGGISQRALSINSAGLNTAGVHVLPLICHRGAAKWARRVTDVALN